MLESVSDTELVARNLLLFVSALIPKAMASLLTSCVIELSKPENVPKMLSYFLYLTYHTVEYHVTHYPHKNNSILCGEIAHNLRQKVMSVCVCS